MSRSDSKRFYTYLHYRLDTMQVFYVGKGCGRRAFHSAKRNPYWTNIATKCGHAVEIAAEWRTEREAFEHEIFLIDTLRSMGHPLVNMTDGGEGGPGFKPSPETSAARSASMRKHWSDPIEREAHASAIRSEKSRKRTSEAGFARWSDPEKRAAASRAIGKSVRRDGVRKKISESVSAWWSDEQNKLRMSTAFREARSQDDIKQRASERRKALWQSESYRSKMEVIHRSDSFKEKMSGIAKASNARRSKPVLCHQTGLVYPSTLAASRQLGLHQGAISGVCNGRAKTTGGYSFEFVTDSSAQAPA